jgi:hypothetical protein
MCPDVSPCPEPARCNAHVVAKAFQGAGFSCEDPKAVHRSQLRQLANAPRYLASDTYNLDDESADFDADEGCEGMYVAIDAMLESSSSTAGEAACRSRALQPRCSAGA